ncbi:2-hydroxyacid dehydrogenase [Roseibium litorale]|uniref:2-hydroxyacid dehydrogenase n=1 Tax=Roseibium litorale TaxID=2803841 RepID=A0ABR9CSM7_9HYPH|nr:2-hydroxyacid dehydrogenase [Roseibium litorale]MBD8893840.1 2-hydroxyacid dehydrogenase [Roseibium litorale]
MSKPEILMPKAMRDIVLNGLEARFTLHKPYEAADGGEAISASSAGVRGLAVLGTRIDAAYLDKFPYLEIVSNFGVGYDNIDAEACGARGIMVTNTPDVLTEEVADTAIGLLIMTVRELSAAERWLRDGNWSGKGPFPLTKASLKDRTLGIVGLGRIGKAIASRAEAFGLKVHYHGRNQQAGVTYPYHATLKGLAETVDTLMLVAPGGDETRHMINAEILKALGPTGILINIGRGTVVDELALIDALSNGTIHAAGLDVFENEPHVPEALMALPNAVLLPHVGSASVSTRDAMGQLVVDNLVSWFETGKAITPVAETAAVTRRS